MSSKVRLYLIWSNVLRSFNWWSESSRVRSVRVWSIAQGASVKDRRRPTPSHVYRLGNRGHDLLWYGLPRTTHFCSTRDYTVCGAVTTRVRQDTGVERSPVLHVTRTKTFHPLWSDGTVAVHSWWPGRRFVSSESRDSAVKGRNVRLV